MTILCSANVSISSRPGLRHFDLCSTHDLEEMFWGMLSPGELSREHLKILIKSMDPGATGKVGLRELMTFVKARQGSGGVGNDSKKAESGLLR